MLEVLVHVSFYPIVLPNFDANAAARGVEKRDELFAAYFREGLSSFLGKGDEAKN